MSAGAGVARRAGARVWRRGWEQGLALAVVLLAAVNFFVGIGTSSLFVDEALSWSIATLGVHDLLDQVNRIEISPPTYYLGLHEWVGRGGSVSEAFMRLPSAVAGIGVVVGVIWIGTRLAGRRSGLLAGALGALSPLILEYAQQARAYVFAMLLSTVAVGAYLELDGGSRHRRLWLVVLVAAAIGSVWCHYTAGLVMVPLLGAGLARSTFRRGEAVVACGAVALGWLALVPTLSDQLSHGNEKGIAAGAGLTLSNLVQALGAPFDGRYGDEGLTFATAVGAAALAAAAVVTARSRRPEAGRLRALALPGAYVPVAAVFFLTLAGKHVLITRYVAVAAPLMLVLVVAGALDARRPLGFVIGGAALLSALTGSIGAHTHDGQYSDIRAVTRTIAADARPTDLVFVGGAPVRQLMVHYNAARQGLLGKLEITGTGRRGPLRSARRRIWIIREPPVSRAQLERSLRARSYRLAGEWRFTPGFDQQLVLAVPRH